MSLVDREGWLEGALQVPSANCDARPLGTCVSLLVIHAISLPPGEFGGCAVTALFTNAIDAGRHPYYESIAALRVSAHLLVRRDGGIVQYVPFAKRAWHAGVSCWKGRERCNDFSIGIELEGSDQLHFSGAQYISLGRLVNVLRQEHPIQDVVGHSDIAPGRKTDPGPFFDWMSLACACGDR